MKRKDFFRGLGGVLLLQYQGEPGGSVFNAKPVSIVGANQPSTEGTRVKSKDKTRELTVIRRPITVAAALIFLAAANLVSTAARATDLVVYATVQNHVAVIDVSSPESPEVCATIDSGVSPTAHSVTVSPDGTQLYVANQGGSMSVMDRATNTIVTEVSISGEPVHVAASPDGMYAYVTGQGGQIWFVDLSANLVSKTIENFINGFPYRSGITTNATGTLAYTGAYSSYNLDIVDTATQTVTGSIATNVAAPRFSAFTPDGKLLYTGGDQTFIYSVDHYIGRVAVIDTDPSSGTYHTQIATVDINTISPYGPGAPQPRDLAFTPNGKELWVPTAGFYTIAVIDTDPASPTYNTEIATVASTQQPIVIKFSPDGTLAFIGHASSSRMRIVDVATRTMLADLPLGGTVWDLAVTTTSGLSCGAPEVTDSDGDGVDDGADLCPGTAAGASVNANGCSAAQLDSDNDGVPDDVDICLGNDASGDTDEDGVCDDDDTCPTDPANADVDEDGLCDVTDLCIGDNATGDSDGDQVCDNLDLCTGNDATGDTDSDGYCDASDNCPSDANADQADADGDELGDVCDADADGDGTDDATDNCPGLANPDQANSDGDSDGDACDLDDDNDGYADGVDNCPLVANADQVDFDGDGFGDACDGDDDADGVADVDDQCLGTPMDVLYDPATGCSGVQSVDLATNGNDPCSFANHGQYQAAVVQAANAARDNGLLTNRERAAIVRAAAKNRCDN